MNERICELAEEAGGQYPRGIYPNAILFYPKDLEKFAQLIVQEILSYTKDGDLDFMKFMVKKNFGVEE